METRSRGFRAGKTAGPGRLTRSVAGGENFACYDGFTYGKDLASGKGHAGKEGFTREHAVRGYGLDAFSSEAVMDR
jgi:hypothetical protein